MEMERINADTIRVFLGSDDLKSRGIKMLDLLSNHEDIEHFFYGVLEEVDTKHEFAGNESVTFQVMPSSGGLEMFISRNHDQDNQSNNKSAARPHQEAHDDVTSVDEFAALAKRHLDQAQIDKAQGDEDDEESRLFTDESTPVAVALRLPDFEAWWAWHGVSVWTAGPVTCTSIRATIT
ncbi:adaptor protein MecA [Lacticaseibacillus thailandensis]|uniref:adaptor protein MecA n=1 Tax=Lacticaseibacillus thailandensis TaxID=381741 RepID=UPI000B1415A6|nr:adaptor protein MecA [Lacticaseibacillus thailandensis]